MDEKLIYRLDDNISFRKCSLFGGGSLTRGTCTCFRQKEIQWKNYYFCNREGIHLHCTKHPEIEYEVVCGDYGGMYLSCPKCNSQIEIDNLNEIISKCLRMLNMEFFKDATLIRLDDWYVPEIKQKEKLESGYWIHTDVKTDKDGDTMIVVYVGHKDMKGKKTQFFIKPEKLQLSSDHKDLDPAQILSKIEVTFKGRKISQEYDEEEI